MNTVKLIGTLGLLGLATTTHAATGSCSDSATLISQIQGSEAESPLKDQAVTVEAVVTGVFQDTDDDKKLSGFFIQEEASDDDGDAKTSEGIFVYHNAESVQQGQLIRFDATVSEYKGTTQLKSVSGLEVCASSQAISATDLTLPLADSNLEHLEGMLLTLPQELTLTLHYNFGRYGQAVLSNGRRYQPTEKYLPGSSEAVALEEANKLNQLLIDDGSNNQNPETISYFPELSASNPLRSGATVSNLQGVLHDSYGNYQLLPTQLPTFVDSNPRAELPPVDKGADLVAGSFNVLNLFTDLDDSDDSPNRGANTTEERERQFAKIVAAIQAADADLLGLMELQNDGFDANSTIQTLVNRLNASQPEEKHYRFIAPADQQPIGDDVITAGIIYRPSVVAPVDALELITDYPFDADTSKHRIPLIQTFKHLDSEEEFRFVVVHFKSKGSSCEALNDPKDPNGQGNCNGLRTDAADTLVEILSDETRAGYREQYMLVGDFNAYSKEDPIQKFIDNELVQLGIEHEGHYSYTYSQLLGSLDHAIASKPLAEKVLLADSWHINSDEPKLFDYNTEYKSDAQRTSYYSADAYRSSDHDPMIVSLKLKKHGGGGSLDYLALLFALPLCLRRMRK